MPRSGPKPTPPTLKLLRGNPGHRPITGGVKLPPAVLAEPDWAELFPGESTNEELCQDVAKAEWRRIVPILTALGLATEVDWQLVVDYCVCAARIRMCESEISRLGVAVLGERGWQKNPATTVVGQYRSQLRFYIGELGLGPSSRGAMKRPGDADERDAKAAAILD